MYFNGISTSVDIESLNYCVLYTKYYIYMQRLFSNNELDLYLCQTQIKTAITIEYNILRCSSVVLICMDNWSYFHLHNK